jgi:hypothetical protein
MVGSRWSSVPSTSVELSPSEVLVELQPGAVLEDAVPPEAHILQRLPPRLAIVTADEQGIRAMERTPAISAVFAGDVPPEKLEQFDQATRTFAAGWNERRRPKQRPGEGLSWDSPGFEPPD